MITCLDNRRCLAEHAAILQSADERHLKQADGFCFEFGFPDDADCNLLIKSSLSLHRNSGMY